MAYPRTTRIPTPLYAAAGVGELAYRQLRKLPTVVTDLGGRAATTATDLRERAALTTSELRDRAAATLRTANSTAASLRGTGADVNTDRLREAALRNVAAVVAGAQAAQERALATYGALVARGERVVGTGVVQAADTVNADITATEAPAGLGSDRPEAADAAPVRAARPRVGDTAATAGPAAVAEASGLTPTSPTRSGRPGKTAGRAAKPATKSTGPGRTDRPNGTA